jgi:hypothetical protein
MRRYQIKEYLKIFQDLHPTSNDFVPTLDRLMQVLNEHIEEEERDDLPTLEKAIPNHESEALARSFRRTKAFVPTRSHPSSPNTPPFETVVALLAAPLDRLMDIFRRFP